MSDLSNPSSDFREILGLIAAARQRAYQAVNTALIDLYWQVGEHLSRKIASAEWGVGVVDELARHIAITYPGMRGFTRPNLFRMLRFYETYRDHEIVAPLVRQLPSSSDSGGNEIVPSLAAQLPAAQNPGQNEIVAALLRQLP